MSLLDFCQFSDELNLEERGQGAEGEEGVVRIVVEVDGRDAPETFRPD